MRLRLTVVLLAASLTQGCLLTGAYMLHQQSTDARQRTAITIAALEGGATLNADVLALLRQDKPLITWQTALLGGVESLGWAYVAQQAVQAGLLDKTPSYHIAPTTDRGDNIIVIGDGAGSTRRDVQ